ncbi:heme ABC exporter ATP-binding protein CcmA [Sphingoaurantiacus capsulatus]|uniref:Heme ABC exporter ATP-binding protein CcmA n=1 Tax=Sphingoaurantiacus capsulatus TaxID=1771310 RepID=A0ABV7X6L0_9SPHN
MTEGDGNLEATDLACVRGGRLIFDALDLRVAPGEALLVQGANGAGKSSLLRLLAGLLRPAAGRIANPFRTAYLGHDNALKGDRTLAQELRFWAAVDEAGDRWREALDRFDLVPLADLPTRLLSSGQKRRAALARTWASGAELWLLDEPSVGLDAPSVDRLAAACAAHRAGGGLIVAATHVPLGLQDARVLTMERAA